MLKLAVGCAHMHANDGGSGVYGNLVDSKNGGPRTYIRNAKLSMSWH